MTPDLPAPGPPPAQGLRILLVDGGSTRTPTLEAQLRQLGADVLWVPLPAFARASPLACHAVVLSGGPHLFTDPDEGPELELDFEPLSRIRLPVLGICLGHQALALSAGGTVFRGEERRAPEPVDLLLSDHPLLTGLPNRSLFVKDHCEGVTLPPGFDCLARSEHYEVEVMSHDETRRYGVQFHPEASGVHGTQLLANFCRLAAAS